MSAAPFVLVVEDDRVARNLLEEILASAGYRVRALGSGREAVTLADAQAFDLVLCDVRMPEVGGMEVLDHFQRVAPATPVILITGFADVTGAIAAVQRGAYDYVSKPFNVDELKLAAARALERRRLTEENRALRRDLGAVQVPEIVGRSPAMLEVYKLVARVAPSAATVLVAGESGTGKELVARAIHRHGPRAAGPFVAVSCSALPESLLESELFGHTRGAFTGAIAARRGLFEEAHGGTLFLDEIADIGPKMQAQLLRVLQEGEVRRVGGGEPLRVDVRIVAATHRDLAAEVAAGRFRDDLFFRIHVVTVRLPSLRERPGDIPLLVEHFLAKIGQRENRRAPALAPEAMKLLVSHAWPGNVRELQNAIERAVAVAKDVVLPADLPPEVTGAAPRPPATILDDRPTLAELSLRYLELVLRECGGNRKRAAEVLGIDRRTLYRMLGRAAEEAEREDGRPEE